MKSFAQIAKFPTRTLFLLVLLELSTLVNGFTVELNPGETFCLHENLKSGDSFLIGYQVQDGPDFNVDFWVKDPRGNILQQYQDMSAKDLTIEPQPNHDGKYMYCFWNKAREEPTKLVSFYLFKDRKKSNMFGDDSRENADHPLQEELTHLKEGLRSIKEDQQYIVIRERIHRDTAESTNTRVMAWGIFQIMIVAATCAFQVWYLTRFFEVKRVV